MRHRNFRPDAVPDEPINMNNPCHSALATAILVGAAGVAVAQPPKSLQFVEAFDAGQPQALILKLYDQQADVICYVLTPEHAARKQADGAWIYEGNHVGAISCVKNRQLVVDVTPSAPVATPAASMPARRN
jgi:hypothetical protein